jgi:hypothetical protein
MTDITEALTAAGVSALVQKQIDPMLLEYQRRFSPLVRALPSQKWGSTVYNFNQRNSRVAGGFVADGGARPVSSSSYTQSAFTMRNLQAVGSVTGYAQEVSRDLIGDLRAREIEGAVQGLMWDIETGLLWGCSGATQNGPYPEFDGIDVQVSSFSGNTQNSSDYAGATIALRHLDILIDQVEQNAASPVSDSNWMFVASTTAISKLAQLLTNQQRFVGQVGQTEIAPGLNVPTYRDVPLVKSSFLGARSLQETAVTASTSTTGGTLAAGAYKYQIGAVISRLGEIQASAEVSQTTTGSTSTVTLAFTPPVGYEGAGAQLYKVYRTAVGGATGTETLLGYVDATVALAADGVTPIATTSIVDTGAALVPQNGATVPAVTPAAYVGTNTGMLPRGAGNEDVYLMSRMRDFVVRPYVRDITPLDVFPTTVAPDTLPFALVTDTCLAIRAPKYASRARNLSVAL